MFGEILNAQGEHLDYTYHPGAPDSNDLAILGHGVTGNKDRPFVVALAQSLADAGIPSLRFSFAGNGDSAGRFEAATISKEVDDLGSILDAIGQRRVCYIGHSMGGAVGVLRAATDQRISFLVSLAGMVSTKKFAETEFGEVVPDQGDMWDDSDCPLSSAYMADLRAIDTVVDRASGITAPWLLVHGTDDDVVLIEDSRQICAAAGGETKLVEMPGADHVFSGDDTAPMIATVVPWLKAQLD
jgi:uncharacterized protein